jgi:hypothetical protein
VWIKLAREIWREDISVSDWMIDGMIGWATVAFLTLGVSLAVRAPYSFLSTFVYALFVGAVVGTPGGILVGRKRDGWIWSVGGGLLSALLVGIVLLLLKVI